MGKAEYTVITLALTIFFLTGTLMKRNEEYHRQEQEEQAPSSYVYEPSANFRISFSPSTLRESSVSDILWLKKAAEVTLDAGYAYFKVRHRKTEQEFNKKLHRQLNKVEGVIEITDDDTGAHYDAYEILKMPDPS